MDFIPRRLTDARELSGLTKSRLAERVQVSAGYIGHLESGKKAPGPDLIAALARELRVRPGFFHRRGRVAVAREQCFWRRRTKTPVRLQKQYVNAATLFGEALDAVGAPESHDVPRLVGQDPAAAAAAVRAGQGLAPDEPVASMVDVLERYGVWVHELSTKNDDMVDAFCTVLPERKSAVVFLNPAKTDLYRTRLSAGHEFAHLAMHDEPAQSAQNRRLQENEANHFSSELLLPSDVWREICPTRGLTSPWSYLDAKARYGISVKALIYKTHRLGLLSDRDFTTANIRYAKLGWNGGEQRPRRARDFDEKPRTGQWILNQVGSLDRLAHLIGCDPALTARLLPGLEFRSGAESKTVSHLRLVD